MWNNPAFDEHEKLTLVHDRASGLSAIIAIHSTHRGPAAGGTRFWHYANSKDAITDALRLSQGMSYKNAMADLPIGGGKAVILADADRTKTPEMLAAFADAVDALGGRYITAEDVGITEADMVAVSKRTRFVTGLPADESGAGGDPGPYTSRGIYLGLKAAVEHKLNRSLDGVHVALQGTGSVGSGLARLLAADGAKLTLADMNEARVKALAEELGAQTVAPDAIMTVPCDVFSPNALGGILTPESIAALDCRIVAGGANNQLDRVDDGRLLADRGILYAPDYVLNAGGIIAVSYEYFARIDGKPVDTDAIDTRISGIADRLREVWAEADSSGEPVNLVADAMARRKIGR
ncbi:Glu/Leu/Phe/Val family dehydrogenase [Croceicoccus mobilis]|uniref:Amino acid dehydrogenase n=1 Tax=Croceicoccus mobilis TaxID=1703339 RepID=A0A916Z2J4_9SPHN|nr:Glu/Leu/Phe/Val dehydrogenase dimerization domain-containing protein [Croceicoccus mobilis]GGD73001.1 amino acid dehydrogenase [Croceicoccus mobilis]